MSPAEFTAPAPPGSSPVTYAKFGRRFGAACLDSLVWVIGLLFYNPLAYVPLSSTGAAIAGLVMLSAWFNYFAFCEWRWGQTIGKNATGIRVLALDGGKLTWQAAAVRNLLRLIDLPLALIGIDYYIYNRSPRRQRLGDRAAKTVVIREPPKVAPATAVPVPPPREVSESAGGATRSSTGFPYATWGPGLALAGLGIGIVGSIVFSIPVAIAAPDLGQAAAPVWANVTAQAVLVASLLGGSLFAATKGRPGISVREAMWRLGLRRFRPSAAGWMALTAVVYLFGAAALSLLLHPKQEDIALDFGPIALQIVFVVIAAAFAEEVTFRGMLFGGLRTRLPRIPAAAIAGVLFGLVHAPTGITAVPVLALLGFLLCLLYERTGSVIPGMLLHALNNTIALLAQ